MAGSRRIPAGPTRAVVDRSSPRWITTVYRTSDEYVDMAAGGDRSNVRRTDLAFAGLGLTIDVASMRGAGWRPIGSAFVAICVLSVTSLVAFRLLF